MRFWPLSLGHIGYPRTKLDATGCNRTLDIHAYRLAERWHQLEQSPPCPHWEGVRQKPCRCSYLPWEAAHHPIARAMRAAVFLINPRCPHHGLAAAGWRWLGPGVWVKPEGQYVGPVLVGPIQLWWAPLGTAAPGADLSHFQGLGRQAPTPWPERQSSVKQLTTGNPR